MAPKSGRKAASPKRARKSQPDAAVTVQLDASTGDAAATKNGAGLGDAPKQKPKGFEQEQWELRMAQTRRWGRILVDTGGSDANSVRQLTRTLKDARAASQVALRRTAVEALVPAAIIGNRGALAAQTKALYDDNEAVRRTALQSLRAAAGGKRAKQGGAVAVQLTEALPAASKVENVEARRAAASALARLAPAADNATTKLALTWVEDSDPWVRSHATKALGLMGPGSGTGTAIAAVAARVADNNWRVSTEAIGALENVARERKAARPDSQGSEYSARSEASTSSRMSRVGSRGGSAKKEKGTNPAKALAEYCSGGSLRGLPRSAAVRALGRAANPGDESAIEAAASQLADVDADVRKDAVEALATIGIGDREKAVRGAALRLTHSDFRVREVAGKAMAEVAEVGDGIACKVAASGLDALDWRSRRGVASALRRLGEAGDGAGRNGVFQVLVPRLEHPDWSIRRKAAQALGEVAKGTGDPRAMKLLMGLTKDPDEEVRIAVAAALPGAAPPKSRDAIQIAATFSQDTEPGIRISALGAIEDLASESRSRSRLAVYAVTKCLEDPEEEVRQVAVRVLISIATGRRTAIDILANLLKHEEAHVRQAAINAFSGVAPANRERALKRTVPLLRHPDADIREAARAATAGMARGEEAAISAAASAVARFRRRFAGPAGHALSTATSLDTSRRGSKQDIAAGFESVDAGPQTAILSRQRSISVEKDPSKAQSMAPSTGASAVPSMAPSMAAQSSAAPSMATSKDPSAAPSMPASLKSSAQDGARAMAKALASSDLNLAATLAEESRQEEEELDALEPVREDTDSEEELSESDTDDDMKNAPPRLTIQGAAGGNMSLINGAYEMSEEAFNGKPQWQKVGDNDKWLVYVDGLWMVSTASSKWLQRKDGFIQSVQLSISLPTEVPEWRVKQNDGTYEVQTLEVEKDPPDPKPDEEEEEEEAPDQAEAAPDAESFAPMRRASAGVVNVGPGRKSTSKRGSGQAP